jgi:hypothetical protein
MSFRERVTENPQILLPCRPGHRSRPRTRAISGNSAIVAPASSASRSRIADEGERRHRRPGESRCLRFGGHGDGSCAPEGMKHGSGPPPCHATVGRQLERREHHARDHADRGYSAPARGGGCVAETDGNRRHPVMTGVRRAGGGAVEARHHGSGPSPPMSRIGRRRRRPADRAAEIGGVAPCQHERYRERECEADHSIFHCRWRSRQAIGRALACADSHWSKVRRSGCRARSAGMSAV